MTNEERVEERLVHAHERGYYDKVMSRLKEIEKLNPKMDKYKLYDIVCDEVKEEWLKENKNEQVVYRAE
jgi:CRISPR/Cas system Type II protein with McrA/HNH and RuvC-like nuclease domain